MATRLSDDPTASAVTIAPAIRAPFGSLTVPTNAPCGVCAAAMLANSSRTPTALVTISSRFAFLEAITLSYSGPGRLGSTAPARHALKSPE